MFDLPEVTISVRGRTRRADSARVHDISIPLTFDAPQPNFFDAPRASGSALTAGSFIGDVARGGSCNCSTYTITPHCNGTHTESVGHVTRDHPGFGVVHIPILCLARLITVSPIAANTTLESTRPVPKSGDLLITRESLEAACQGDLDDAMALVIRTLPNPDSKKQRSYGPDKPPAFFSADAMQWMIAQNIEHLIVDLPSIDRAEDEGQLTAHRIFWGLPPGSTTMVEAQRPNSTITELAYIDDAIVDGLYVLNLQLPPFQSDAAPSRPLLLPLVPA